MHVLRDARFPKYTLQQFQKSIWLQLRCMYLTEAVEPTLDQRLELMQLWNEEYPQQLCYQSVDEFDKYLSELTDKIHILLLDEKNRIKGWGLLFGRSGETWFLIILQHSAQGLGNGTVILNMLKSKTDQLSGWVTDHDQYRTAKGAVYNSPLRFYLKNGFSVCADTRYETEKLSAVKVAWSR